MGAHTNRVGHKQQCCFCGQGRCRGQCITCRSIVGVPQSIESESQNRKARKWDIAHVTLPRKLDTGRTTTLPILAPHI